jgi:hypothetical protein
LAQLRLHPAMLSLSCEFEARMLTAVDVKCHRAGIVRTLVVTIACGSRCRRAQPQFRPEYFRFFRQRRSGTYCSATMHKHLMIHRLWEWAIQDRNTHRNPAENQVFRAEAAESGTPPANAFLTLTVPDLAEVITTWPRLPAVIQSALLAMV